MYRSTPSTAESFRHADVMTGQMRCAHSLRRVVIKPPAAVAGRADGRVDQGGRHVLQPPWVRRGTRIAWRASLCAHFRHTSDAHSPHGGYPSLTCIPYAAGVDPCRASSAGGEETGVAMDTRGAWQGARAGPLDDSAALPASSPRAARGDERALRRASVLRVVVPAVAADYAAQVPYYLHQYGATRHAPPSLPGTAMLAATLLWFALGVVGLRCGSARGYWLLVSFLAVESLLLSADAGRAGSERPRGPPLRPPPVGPRPLRRLRHRLRQPRRGRVGRLLPAETPCRLPRAIGDVGIGAHPPSTRPVVGALRRVIDAPIALHPTATARAPRRSALPSSAASSS